MTYDRAWLESCYRGKQRPAYLFFWGHQPARDGSISTSCLSQGWPARFVVDGISYPTAEHWMMAAKARLFGDENIAARIIVAGSPKQVKELGRQVKGFDEGRWNAAKREIVTRGNFEKFRQNPALSSFLVDTRSKVLVEASPVDRVWGIGLAADNPKAANPLEWRGANLLGFALMDVRDRLADAALCRSPQR